MDLHQHLRRETLSSRPGAGWNRWGADRLPSMHHGEKEAGRRINFPRLSLCPSRRSSRGFAIEGGRSSCKGARIDTEADLRGGGELPWIGYRIFKWLLLLIFIILILLVAFAYLTYPRIGDIQKLAGSRTNIDIIKEWSDARSAWVTQMKDLGQIFLFTPVFPLLAAVVGYIFGRQQQLQSTDGTREQAPEAPEEPCASTRCSSGRFSVRRPPRPPHGVRSLPPRQVVTEDHEHPERRREV